MKQILLLFFIMIGFGLSGQVSFGSERTEVIGKASDTEIQTDLAFTNDLAEEISTFWNIDRVNISDQGQAVPEEWEFKLCDNTTCYVWGLEQCPSSNPSIFDANESVAYNLYLNPHGTAGSGDIVFNITLEDGSVITTVPILYDIAAVSGVSEADLEVKQVKLYPNPTTDYIQITNDNNVSKVAFYNIVGKRLNTSTHFSGKSHDVSTLQKGIYLVRLFDENDKVISVIRMNKN